MCSSDLDSSADGSAQDEERDGGGHHPSVDIGENFQSVEDIRR